MTLTGTVNARRVAAVLLALALVSGLFLGNQRHVQAQVTGHDIVCDIVDPALEGLPFNPNCDEDNGGGGPTPQEQCGLDHGFWDGDSCEAVPTCNSEAGETYNSETNQCVPPTPPPDPVDLCPNWDDVQPDVPAGFHVDEQGNCVEDGNGDTGTVDENPGTSGSNGGHHSGGAGLRQQLGGLVMGVEDCSQYLTAFMRLGAQNDTEQVTRLQKFFNQFEDMTVPESGVFDQATLKAVHSFQTKYASDILTPWGASQSTGYVFYTTQKKVNELYCKGTKQFPLSDSAEEYIGKIRAGGYVPAPTSKPTKVSSKVDLSASAANSQTEQVDESEDKVTPTPTSKGRGFWGSMGDFFSNVLRFGR
ncbi:hypothetical protein KW798_03145 [Candidatus Parcubacteria bacterium]|nr:hypothetical protein [Candidatus Parcubacteria bacterium]